MKGSCMMGPRFPGTGVAVGGQSLPPSYPGAGKSTEPMADVNTKRSLSVRRQRLCFLNLLALSQTGCVKIVWS